MDDPVHPSDLTRLEEELRRRETTETHEAGASIARARRQAEELRKERRNTSLQESELTPSQFGRALNEEQRPPKLGGRYEKQRSPNLGGDSLDYSYRVLEEILTTKQQQQTEPAKTVVASTDISADPLIEKLVEKGITRQIASGLVTDHPRDIIERQIAMLDYRQAKDPAAVLVAAIHNDWAPPAAYLQAQADQEKTQRRQRKAQQARQEKDARIAQETALKAEQDAFWDSLSSSEQTRILQAAQELIRQRNPVVAASLTKSAPGPLARALLEACRRELLADRIAQESLSSKAPPGDSNQR